MWNKKMKKCFAYLLCVCVLSCTGLQARAAEEPKKEEAVNIKADASGKVYRATSEITLSGFAEGKEIKDKSALEDIRNISGDEEFTSSAGGSITWENHGTDIRYKGDADAGELPVGVKITYYLDGKKTVPEQMAGKSGEVRIRFEYENKTKGEDYVPFVFLTAVFLPEDVFTDIEVENGSLSRIDDVEMIIGYGAPGLREALHLGAHDRTSDLEIPEYFEITAKATDFSLDFTATVVSSGLLKDRDLEDLDETEEGAEDLDDLEDASQKLVDALKKLSDGSATFRDSLRQYTDGATSLADAAAKLDAILSQMDFTAYGEAGLQLKGLSAQLSQGAKSFAENGKQLTEGYDRLHQGIRDTADGMRKFHNEAILELRKSLSPEGLQDITDALHAVQDADRAYDSFSGKPDGVTGSVRFLIETDAIKP